MIEINRNPSAKQLRWVGGLILLFFALIAAIAWWRFDARTVAYVLVAFGGVVCAVFYAVPQWRRAIYLGWMYAAYPIGWVISHILLAMVFYLVITPIGLIMRLLGKDPLQRDLDPDAPTYWTRRPPAAEPQRYFRQF